MVADSTWCFGRPPSEVHHDVRGVLVTQGSALAYGDFQIPQSSPNVFFECRVSEIYDRANTTLRRHSQTLILFALSLSAHFSPPTPSSSSSTIVLTTTDRLSIISTLAYQPAPSNVRTIPVLTSVSLHLGPGPADVS